MRSDKNDRFSPNQTRPTKNKHEGNTRPDQTSPDQTRPAKNKHEGKTRPDQTQPRQSRPDQTRPAKNKHEGKTRPDQNRPDQTNQTSQENFSITSYFQKRRFGSVCLRMFCLLNQCFTV